MSTLHLRSLSSRLIARVAQPWHACWVVMLSVIAASPMSAFALNPNFSLSQYQHTTWTERDGAPANVRGISQTSDGYLWVASPRGLSRFDGVSFELIRSLGGEPVNEEISLLFAGPSGELFMNFANGRGAAAFVDGHLVKLPRCVLSAGAIVVGGVTWLICNRRPARLIKGDLEPVSTAWNYPDVETFTLSLDKDGTIWAAARGQVLALAKATRSFISYPRSLDGPDGLAPDGALWTRAAAAVSVTTVRDAKPAEVEHVPRSFSQLQFDRNGGVWAADVAGLKHWQDGKHFVDSGGIADAANELDKARGMTSDLVTAMYEDQMGAIWVGTSTGLERFRNNHLFPIRLPGRNLAFSITAGDDGSIWAANYFGSLMRVTDSTVEQFPSVAGGISVLSRDRDGTVWVAADMGRLWKIRGREITRAMEVPGPIRGSAITSVTTDPSGAVWIGSTVTGVVGAYSNGAWRTPSSNSAAEARWSSRTLLADKRGRIWASSRYEVTVLDHGLGTRYSVSQGVDVGEVRAISERNERIWIGGADGVAYFDGATFQKVLPSVEDAFDNVTGVLETADGDLWIHAYDAVIRVSADELLKRRGRAAYQVKFERFGPLDGHYGFSQASASRASIVEATDGRLWFSTSEGVMVVDPKKPRALPAQPKVLIQQAVVDGKVQDLAQQVSLPRNAKSIRFIYTAPSPWGAENLKFRYRLEGLDTEWNEVGNRRAITYSNLKPGDYRFRVVSSDNSGAWLENEALLAFNVMAAWYESRTAHALALGASAIALLFVIRSLRLKRVSRRVRWHLRMQQAERERLARDLHDTLLQGVHGLTWRIQTIANSVALTDPVRGKLESALDTAEGLLVESRRRLSGLREEHPPELMLSTAIENVVSSTATTHQAAYRVVLLGEEKPVRASIEINICDIVREAFINAVLHGQATSIEVSLEFTQQVIVVRVADNGLGIDPAMAKTGRAGHWGLAGMRERARESNGALYVGRVPGGGTEVTLQLRTIRALKHSANESFLQRVHRLLRRG